MNMEFWLLMILSNMIVISLLFYTKIYLVLTCKRNHSNDYIKIEVYAIKGLLLYSMQVPIIDIIRGDKSLWVESKITTGNHQDKTHTQSEQRVVKKNIKYYMTHPIQLKHLIKELRYYTRLYSKAMDKIIKSLHCEKFCWKTSYGTEDAAVTAIAVGILWTVKSLLLTRLQRQVSFESKPMIHVTPIFNHDDLKIDFECIFSIRLGNVITAMRSLYSVKR